MLVVKKIIEIISKNKLATPIFLIFIALLLYHGWLGSGVIARTDLFLPSNEWVEDNLSLPQLWKEGGGHAVSVYEAHYYLYFLWAFLSSKIGIGIDLGRRLIWLTPFFIGIFSIYFLTTLMFKDKLAGFVASIYFMASNMVVWAAHVSWIQGIAGLGLAPLVFAFFVRGFCDMERNSFLKDFLLSGLILSIIVWYDMKIAILTYGLLISFSVFQMLRLLYVSRNNHGVKMTPVLWYLTGLSIVALLPVILNLHVILPHILIGSSGMPAVSNQPAYLNVSGKGNTLYSLLFTYDSPVQNGQVFLPFLAIISIATFSAIILCKRCQWVVFFALFNVILISLSKDITFTGRVGFGSYLYKYLPGFVGFRDPNKFLLFQTLPTAILLGVSVSELGKKIYTSIVKVQNQ